MASNLPFEFFPRIQDVIEGLQSDDPQIRANCVRQLEARDRDLENFLSSNGGTISTQFGQIVEVKQNILGVSTGTNGYTDTLTTELDIPADTNFTYKVRAEIHAFCRMYFSTTDAFYLQAEQEWQEWLPGVNFEVTYGYGFWMEHGSGNNTARLTTPQGVRVEDVSAAPGTTAHHDHTFLIGMSGGSFEGGFATTLTLYAFPI